MVSEQTSLAV